MPLAAAASATGRVASNWPGTQATAMRAAMLTVDPKMSFALRMTGPWFSADRVSGRRGSFRHASSSVPSAWIAQFRFGKREHRLIPDPFDRRLVAGKRLAHHALENLENIDGRGVSVDVRDGAEPRKIDECNGRCARRNSAPGSCLCPSRRCSACRTVSQIAAVQRQGDSRDADAPSPRPIFLRD